MSSHFDDLRVPRIYEPAPDFEGASIDGPVRLAAYAGRQWVVLFLYPGRFGPLASAEFAAFARLHGEFARLNVQLLSAFGEPGFGDAAWVAGLQSRLGLGIPFPVVADREGQVNRRYGLTATAGKTAVRAVFVIDDHGLVRAFNHYPLTTGRTAEEALRLVQALQLADKYQPAADSALQSRPQPSSYWQRQAA